MDKILIVSNLLKIGGAEKLIFELVKFCKEHDVKPTILILNNFEIEHYDHIYKTLNIKVIRTRIDKIKNFRDPIRMITSLYWKILLVFYAKAFYKSIHVIGLYNVENMINHIKHNHRFFWHVNNRIQFKDEILPYNDRIFRNPKDTVVCINEYQLEEIDKQYQGIQLFSKIVLFKLFVNG